MKSEPAHTGPLLHPSIERRGGQFLIDYWQRLCKGRPYPLEDEIDPCDIEEIWEHCFLIQRRDVEHVAYYNYTYIGPGIVAAYESGKIGALIPGLAHIDAAHLGKEYMQVFETGKPLLYENEYCLDALTEIRFRQCLVPLGNHEEKIGSILGLMGYRLYDRSPSD